MKVDILKPMKFEFSPDLPIASSKEDLLNRTTFAKALASAINRWRQKSSIVIALYGEWGSGKSSIKNLMLANLEGATVVEFNPWQITNRDRLTEAFFNDIGAVLGRPKGDNEEEQEAAKTRASKWKLYSSLFGIFHRVSAVAAPLAGGYLATQGHPGALATAQAITKITEQASALSKTGAEALEAAGSAFSPTLAEMRRQVSELLSELERPILVVLDDIDRLTKDEIRLMLQVVKANADFPNLIYLILAQRATLEQALDGFASEKGADYLEKIVQVSFHVPIVSRAQLEKILFESLDKLLLESETITKRWDQEHWQGLVSPFSSMFGTLRDVKRYLSSLAFHFEVFRSERAFEVNPADLIALEAMRLFAPALHEALPVLKSVLTDEPKLLRTKTEEEDKKLLQLALERATGERSAQVEALLRGLFPNADKLLGNNFRATDGDYFPQLRVCSHEVFDRYFQLSIPVGDISQSDIEAVLSAAGDLDQLRVEFRRAADSGLLDVLLDRLDSLSGTIPIINPSAVLTALCDLEVSHQDLDFFSTKPGPLAHLVRIVYRYLRREPEETKRLSFLKDAFTASRGLYTPVYVAVRLTARAEENASDPNAVLKEAVSLKELQGLAVEKIRTAAASGRLKQEHDLRLLLVYWSEWGDPQEVTDWVRTWVQSRDGLLGFLTATRHKVLSSGLPRERFFFGIKDVERFLPVEEVAAQLARYDVAEFATEEKTIAAQFIKALERFRSGEPDLDFMSTSFDEEL